jgi:hypothetical protein
VVSVEWVRVEGTGLESYMGRGMALRTAKVLHTAVYISLYPRTLR